MLDDKYKDRSIIIHIVLALIIIIFVGRLAHLQLYEDYTKEATGNAFYHKPIYAPRGLIYDRNGKLSANLRFDGYDERVARFA